jgi:hypothetical protein
VKNAPQIVKNAMTKETAKNAFQIFTSMKNPHNVLDALIIELLREKLVKLVKFLVAINAKKVIPKFVNFAVPTWSSLTIYAKLLAKKVTTDREDPVDIAETIV